MIMKDIHSNVRKGGRIRSSVTGRLVELDLWVPSKDIAFEFQVCESVEGKEWVSG